MKRLLSIPKRVWTELTLTWTRPVGVVALIAIGAMSSSGGQLGEAAPFALIAVAVVLAPIEFREAKKAHRRHGTPRLSNRGITIRGGICLVLAVLCGIGAYFAYADKDSTTTEGLGSLGALFGGLTWLYLFSLRREAKKEAAAEIVAATSPAQAPVSAETPPSAPSTVPAETPPSAPATQ